MQFRIDPDRFDKIKAQMPNGIYTPKQFCEGIKPDQKFFRVKIYYDGDKFTCEIEEYILHYANGYYGRNTQKEGYVYKVASCDDSGLTTEGLLEEFLLPPDACFVIASKNEEDHKQALSAAKYYRSLLDENWQDLVTLVPKKTFMEEREEDFELD